MMPLTPEEAAMDFYVPCPHCHTGTVDTHNGIRQVTDAKVTWVGIRCTECDRPFTLDATRTPPP